MTQSQTTFRPLTTDDLATLQSIRHRAFRPIFQGFRATVDEPIATAEHGGADAEQAAWLDRICRENDDGIRVVVAVRDDRPIGFCGYHVDPTRGRGEINLNAIDPAHQGRGDGVRMYEHVLDLMRQAGAAYFVVSTGGDAQHAPARAAYRKAGFGMPIPSMALYRSA